MNSEFAQVGRDLFLVKRIPFSLTKVYEGFAETEGLAHFDGETLYLEFRTKDSFVGLLKSDVKQVPLRIGDLEFVSLKHRMFHSRLTLRAQSLGAVEPFPNRRGSEVMLRFKRSYRAEVEEIASAMVLAISEARLACIEETDWLDEEGERVC